MSKFKVGDIVVCIDADDSDLDLHAVYTIQKVDPYSEYEAPEVFLEENSLSWLEHRFELFDEWVLHQKRVSVKDKLALTKIQVESLQSSVSSLQELKKNNETIMREALNTILWLYRRLPKGYANLPHVDGAIMQLGKALDQNVEEFILERSK